MKRLFTLLVLFGAILLAQDSFAQGGDKKKKKKKSESEQTDSTSVSKPTDEGGSGAAEITIDEPGTSKGKTHGNTNKSADSTKAPSGLERPKEVEEAPAPKEAGEAKKDEQPEADKPAESPTKATETAPDAPGGAGSLEASPGTSLTIDEAGTQKAKTPASAAAKVVDVNPTSLTIDEAGTQKAKKAVEAPNLAPNTDSLKQKAGGKIFDLVKPK